MICFKLQITCSQVFQGVINFQSGYRHMIWPQPVQTLADSTLQLSWIGNYHAQCGHQRWQPPPHPIHTMPGCKTAVITVTDPDLTHHMFSLTDPLSIKTKGIFLSISLKDLRSCCVGSNTCKHIQYTVLNRTQFLSCLDKKKLLHDNHCISIAGQLLIHLHCSLSSK